MTLTRKDRARIVGQVPQSNLDGPLNRMILDQWTGVFPSVTYIVDTTISGDTELSAAPSGAYLGDLIIVRLTSSAAPYTVTFSGDFAAQGAVVTSGVEGAVVIVTFVGTLDDTVFTEISRVPHAHA